MKTPAYIVLHIISAILVALGLFLMIYSALNLFSNDVLLNQNSRVIVIIGVALLLVGFKGPVRIIYLGASIPAEIKLTISVLAFTLPLTGAAFIFAGIINEPTLSLWAYLIAGLLILLSAALGFYPLTRKLPDNLYVSEMLSIIKSAGISGNKEDSAADQAMKRWTKGRQGVPVGRPAPDASVITLQGEDVLLSSFFGANPLVLNIASYSCPHHRKRINELQKLMENWQHKNVDFLTVYTAEAHTEDGWKLVDQYVNDDEYTNEDDFCFSYAKNINERKKMAEWLIEKKDFAMTVVLDTMEDKLLKAYNSWPIRLYIIHNSKVVYCGDQGPFGYEPASVDLALKKLLNA